MNESSTSAVAGCAIEKSSIPYVPSCIPARSGGSIRSLPPCPEICSPCHRTSCPSFYSHRANIDFKSLKSFSSASLTKSSSQLEQSCDATKNPFAASCEAISVRITMKGANDSKPKTAICSDRNPSINSDNYRQRKALAHLTPSRGGALTQAGSGRIGST